MEGNQGIDHGGHGNQGEETSRDLADLVTEVEETDGKTAQDDGEVQPTEKSTLVGEKDLGLDTSGQGDALAYEEIGSVFEVVGSRKASRARCVPGAVWRSGCEDMMAM